ncbi:MAG: hypothetical protein B1H03_03860 [Planctomycetales bacterium 4484_113]|mgnify:CR=1 FL=1|nr:MAG: hypothetical protein B1H03_03860 [Planctomycetales bacterium 4484_113]
MTLVDFTVVPLGSGSTSLSSFVALVQQELEKSGLSSRLNPMSTTVEGDLGDILAFIKRLHAKLRRAGYQRISTSIKIDDRFDKPGPHIERKMRVVKRKLSRRKGKG